MSWSGLKKNFTKASTSVKARTGHLDRTGDREFEDEEKRAEALKSRAEHLHRQANGYAKAMREMSGAQVRLANILEQFYEEGETMSNAGIKYRDAVTKLEEKATEEEGAYRVAVLEPVGRYYSYFPEITEAIRRRNKTMVEYENAKAKVRKLVERPSEDSNKLPRAEHDANICRDMFEAMNAQLMAELPKVVEARVSYIDPSFEAVVKSQLSHAQDSLNTFEALRQHFPPEPQDHVLSQQTEGVLQHMRDLTICGLA
ncbi:hypothetical protein BGZ76_003771 [Entomortierella beljakovae]|nr:hypothetical protein BGZ76_003771 [Entomortierella beljakovae]